MSFEHPASNRREQELGSDRKDAKQERESTMPRRGFLRLTLGGLAAGVVLSAKGKEHHVAEAADSRTETYDEVVAAVRKESWEIPREQIHIYTRKKNGLEFSRKLDEGTASSGSIPIKIFEEVKNNDMEHMEVIHTHTLSSMYPDFGDRDKARSGELPILAMSPSFMDVASAIDMMHKMGQEASQKMRFKAGDPGGVWEYIPDITNSFSRKLIKMQTEIATIGDQKEMREFIRERKIEDNDPRLIFQWMVELKQELPKVLQDKVTKILFFERELMNDENIQKIIALENSARGFEHGSMELKELIKRYQAIGVKITFTSYR